MSGVSLQYDQGNATSFAAAHSWRPEPAPEVEGEPDADPVTVAVHLLRAIAEDALVRPSHRVAARRCLRRLGEGAGGGTGATSGTPATGGGGGTTVGVPTQPYFNSAGEQIGTAPAFTPNTGPIVGYSSNGEPVIGGSWQQGFYDTNNNWIHP
jgi:hypothetical protein